MAGASVTVTALSARDAARALAGMAELDPRGLTCEADIASMCSAGHCFGLVGAVEAVYVLSVRNGVAWIEAARVTDQATGIAVDATELLDGVITAQAQGLNAIACQTARPGLVRKLQRRGYRVTGWVLKKDLPCLQ